MDLLTDNIIDERYVLNLGFVKLQKIMGDERDIVAAARISVPNSKWTSSDEKLLKYLWDHKHTSPFEQVTMKFHVKAPLFVVAQWERHRTWSYNQISARYSEMQDEFYLPELSKINKQSTDNKQGRAKETVEDSEKAQIIIDDSNYESNCHYHELLDLGVSKELARIVLPQALYTEFIGTVNFWNLLHFLDLRADAHAQYEIRVYADAIIAMLRPLLPYTMGMIFNKGWK